MAVESRVPDSVWSLGVAETDVSACLTSSFIIVECVGFYLSDYALTISPSRKALAQLTQPLGWEEYFRVEALAPLPEFVRCSLPDHI